MTENIELKWGTLVDWHLEKDESLDIVKRFVGLGVKMAAIFQHNTPEQKQLLIELIDSVDGEIWNGWTDDKMSKEEAKAYIENYDKD